ncbi:MAG: response regulator [Elusimicrobiota bacterium]
MTKVLIVEDDFALSENLQSLLKAKGFEVEAAPDGPAGIAAARKFLPDLVLLDIMIPKLSGFEVCRTLRSEEATKGIKILMTTGLDRMADVEKAFSSGAADYLVKPFDSERLLKKIKKVLGRDTP